MDTPNEQRPTYAAATDVGCVRDLNEDSVYSSESLWLVADGMGGHACGEVASRIAAEVIPKEWAKSQDLTRAVEVAHQQIIKASGDGVGQKGMGTTVVVLRSEGNRYQLAWVGDSRAYMWHEKSKRLSQLSEDHSFINRLIGAGLLKKEDAQHHPQRHMITQCLGSEEISQLKVDSIEGEWRRGEVILLCSDGLTDELEDDEIANIMATHSDIESRCQALVDAAKAAGGRDNISVVLVASPIPPAKGFWQKLRQLFVR